MADLSEELSIGEVGRRAGVRPSTLRYYESVGLLAPPRRRHTRRCYDPGILQQLVVIAVAQQAGFTIAEIGLLLHGFEDAVTPSARWRALAEQKLAEVEALLARTQAMKRLLEQGLACGCLNFDECMIVAAPGCAAPRPPVGAPAGRVRRPQEG